MKNTVMLWGSKSKAKIVKKLIENYKEELNLHFIKSKKKKLKLNYIFDPFSQRASFKTKAKFSNKDDELKNFIKKSKFFVVCIGNHHGKARYMISKNLEKLNLNPLNLVNKFSYIDKSSKIGKGLLAMPNSVVHCYSTIGDYCILNTSSIVEHECSIGNGVHIMSGASISGKVKLGDYVTIGANATILPGIKISEGAFIGAGAVVTKDVKKNQIVAGIPAKFIKKNKHEYDLSSFEKIRRKK
tara:strand:- start:22265 stop:22990 length:726 start_codon:yes stop_codon:yes gene_type:complete